MLKIKVNITKKDNKTKGKEVKYKGTRSFNIKDILDDDKDKKLVKSKENKIKQNPENKRKRKYDNKIQNYPINSKKKIKSFNIKDIIRENNNNINKPYNKSYIFLY